MFVATVFRGSRAWVFDPARRPGMPKLRLLVSTASGSAVRRTPWGDTRTPPQRLLLLPGQTEADVIDRLRGSEFGDPGLPLHDAESPGGGVPVGWADAVFDLALWRGRVDSLADDSGRGPELLAALRSRPDTLAGSAGSFSPTVVNGLLARAEAFPGHLVVNQKIGGFMAEGGKVYACRFALSALYGQTEAALIPGIKPINPLDVLDIVLLHRKANAFILNTWTL